MLETIENLRLSRETNFNFQRDWTITDKKDFKDLVKYNLGLSLERGVQLYDDKFRLRKTTSNNQTKGNSKIIYNKKRYKLVVILLHPP